MDFRTSALILAWAAILILSFAMAGLLRQVRYMSGPSPPRRSIALPKDVVAPPLPVTPDGTEWKGPWLALFLDASCRSCERALRQAESQALSLNGELEVLALFRGSADEFRPARVKVVENANDTFDRFQVPFTPFGVVISQDGRIAGSAPLGSEEALSQLLQETHERR